MENINNKHNELNFGEIISLHGFWETCRYYVEKHKKNNSEIKVFSFSNGPLVFNKENDNWYIIENHNKVKMDSCYDACVYVIRYLSLDKEEEEELLNIFVNNVKNISNRNELTETYKVFKKVLK